MTDPWLDPLLTECSCRHCRAGRMCRAMADRFRAYVRVRADTEAGIDVHSIDMEEQRGQRRRWWRRSR